MLVTASLAAGLWDWLRHGTPTTLGDARRAALERLPADPRARVARVAQARSISAASRSLLLRRRCSALACVAIRLESTGSPIYRQRRVGKDGVQFDLLQAPHDGQRRREDGRGAGGRRGRPAHHRVGAVVRRLSLDELPNLINVLRGRDEPGRPAADGPGAGRPVHASASSAGSRSRPGITGWAQVKGRAALPWHERIELDLWYVEHWSLRLDLRILAETVQPARQRQGPLPRADRRLAPAAAG